MYTATVTSKGQVTLPAKMRKDLGLKKADRVLFSKQNGNFVLEKLPSIDSLFGYLANPKIKPLTIAQMNRVVEKEMFGPNDIA